MNYNIYKNTEVELMTQKYYRYNFAIEKLPLTKTDYETIDYVALTIKSISLSFDTSKIGEFPGNLVFFSMDQDKKIDVDYVGTSDNLQRRLEELFTHPKIKEKIKNSILAFAYEPSRSLRYRNRNLLNILNFKRVMKIN